MRFSSAAVRATNSAMHERPGCVSRASVVALAAVLVGACNHANPGPTNLDGGGAMDASGADASTIADGSRRADVGSVSDSAIANDDAPTRNDAGPTGAGACDAPLPNLAGQLLVDGLSEPIFMTHPPDSDDLYIVQRRGQIRIFRDGALLPTDFLDISSTTGGYSATGGDERGLMSLAFHPNYAENGRFFVAFTPTTSSPRENVVAQGQRSASNADVADGRPETILSLTGDFANNHNGGMIAFGPDGYLYIATGDGGGGGDPNNWSQDRSSLFGKLLRIDVDSSSPYGIPRSNPFIGMPPIRDEIWAYGLRNPWRFSFDRETGDLWIGDVGQDAIEEIDFQPADSEGGENYGWDAFEGTRIRRGSGVSPLLPTGATHTEPIFEYSRDDFIPNAGVSVTGGYVYRGSAIPELVGAYVFADLQGDGPTAAFRLCDGVVESLRGFTALNALGRGIYSFAEGNDGELYIVYGGTPGRNDGRIYRIVAAP